MPSGEETAFTFTVLPPFPSIWTTGPEDSSGFPQSRLQSALVSTRASTLCALAGDQCIDSFTWGLQSLLITSDPVPWPPP